MDVAPVSLLAFSVPVTRTEHSRDSVSIPIMTLWRAGLSIFGVCWGAVVSLCLSGTRISRAHADVGTGLGADLGAAAPVTVAWEAVK